MPTDLRGTLRGTLVGPQTEEQAAFDRFDRGMNRIRSEAAQQSRQAAQAEQDALVQLQQAQQAPIAGLAPPLLALIPLLTASLASTVSGDPFHREQAQEELKQDRRLTLQQRAENLQTLRERVSEAAQDANRIGDRAQEIKLRSQMISLEKQLDETLAGARESFAERTARITEERKAAREEKIATTRFNREQKLAEQRDAEAFRRAQLAAGIDPKTGRPRVKKGQITPQLHLSLRTGLAKSFSNAKSSQLERHQVALMNHDFKSIAGETAEEMAVRLFGLTNERDRSQSLYRDDEIITAVQRAHPDVTVLPPPPGSRPLQEPDRRSLVDKLFRRGNK